MNDREKKREYGNAECYKKNEGKTIMYTIYLMFFFFNLFVQSMNEF